MYICKKLTFLESLLYSIKYYLKIVMFQQKLSIKFIYIILLQLSTQ
jgi:hypothetical protein